jgi:RNA recognition motif-containing protein
VPEHQQEEAQVAQLISQWPQAQLVRVLSKLGSEHAFVLQAIALENQNDLKLRKVFVRNLPYTATQTWLQDYFSQYGNLLEAVIVMDIPTAASKGFGFLTYETIEAASACLREPTKHMDDGRQIFVNLASKKEGMVVATGSNPVGRRDDDSTMRKLFVWSLSYETTSQQLLDFFKAWGDVAEAVILTNRDSGTSKGFGFVTMATEESAALALAEPVKQMAGRSIHVKLAAASDDKHPGTLVSVPAYGQYGGMAMGMYGGIMGYPAQYQYPPVSSTGYQTFSSWS